jgi:hypothetical protein
MRWDKVGIKGVIPLVVAVWGSIVFPVRVSLPCLGVTIPSLATVKVFGQCKICR